jgi:nicotinamidase/pyrazinamidase
MIMTARNKPRLELLIIDPQNSFCHPTKGELYVPGAERDMKRLAALIDRLLYDIADIHVTLDTHHELDVAHPIFWLNNKGEHPEPFTLIAKQDVIDGVWTPFNPKLSCSPYGTLLDRMIDYVTKLEESGRYQLTIWPPHCRIGTPGHNVVEELRETLRKWELSRYAMVDYVMKGSNVFTEHYSGVQAEVPDPDDPATHLNTGLMQALEEADIIGFSGEASTHCVANTIRDIAKNFGEDSLKKWVLLEDTMSPVPGFEHFADEFFREMKDKGVKITTTTEFSI